MNGENTAAMGGAQETGETIPAQTTETNPQEVDSTVAATEGEQGTETPDDAPKPFITVKHSNADRELTEQEAIDAIQQGLFAKEHDGIPFLKWAQQQAKKAGFNSLSEYQEAIDKQMVEAEARQLEEEQMIPHETAMELVEARKTKEAIAAQQQAERDKEAQIAQYQQELADFKAEFPDVDITAFVNNLPQEIREAKHKHPEKSLADLYARYKLKQAASTARVQEQEQQNKQTATGGLKSDGEPVDDYYQKIKNTIMG